jgi:hypothetical protein
MTPGELDAYRALKEAEIELALFLRTRPQEGDAEVRRVALACGVEPADIDEILMIARNE